MVRELLSKNTEVFYRNTSIKVSVTEIGVLARFSGRDFDDDGHIDWS